MPGASPAYCCRRATRRWHSRLLRADAVDDAVNDELALAVDGQDRDWHIRTITRLRVDRDRPRCPEQSIRFEDCLRRCLRANLACWTSESSNCTIATPLRIHLAAHSVARIALDRLNTRAINARHDADVTV